jgi:hypothetical protein
MERIQSALKAVTEQSYAPALEAIKPIGLRSIFISWKWLVKGLCAFYGQEDGKALAAFNKIPAGTIPGTFAASYAQLLAKSTVEEGAVGNLRCWKPHALRPDTRPSLRPSPGPIIYGRSNAFGIPTPI